jgi:hypothetical protein
MTRGALMLAAAALAGCAGGGGAATSNGAHVLFLVRPGCTTVVARTLAGGDARAFTVMSIDAPDYAPRAGDVLEGPARAGRSVFVFYPEEALGNRGAGRSVPADVLATGLDPSKARQHLDAACPGEGV